MMSLMWHCSQVAAFQAIQYQLPCEPAESEPCPTEPWWSSSSYSLAVTKDCMDRRMAGDAWAQINRKINRSASSMYIRVYGLRKAQGTGVMVLEASVCAANRAHLLSAAPGMHT
jgi:hypothetical protein